MADETKPLSSGDRWRPTASGLNGLQDAANYVEDLKRGGGSLANPQTRRELGTVVLVKNESSTQENWPIWSPVIVCVPEGKPVDRAVAFASRPYFPGYRPDDVRFAYYPMLGITQEPIAYGKTGRVCIHGITPALIQKCPSDWTDNGHWDWVHVRKNGSRWTLRNGPGGDARFVQFLDFDMYQDGTYNDQYLALIDLCSVPNRVRFWNLSGETAPMHSIIRWDGRGHSYKLDSSDGSYSMWNPSYSLAATCGWDVSASNWGWAYRFDSLIPVCVSCVVPGMPGGPAGGSWQAWPYLPGFGGLVSDWSKSGQPSYWWVYKSFSPFWAKAQTALATGGSAWACDQTGTYIFDGGTHGSFTFPVVRTAVRFPANSVSSGITRSRQANVQQNQIIQVTLDITNSAFLGDAGYMDDPIGTVKLWVGYTYNTLLNIPSGWRELTRLQGRFPVGFKLNDPTFGDLAWTGGSTTHTHGLGSGSGSGAGSYGQQAANHLPPYQVMVFIERYQ
jgi:hypothetical protein